MDPCRLSTLQGGSGAPLLPVRHQGGRPRRVELPRCHNGAMCAPLRQLARPLLPACSSVHHPTCHIIQAGPTAVQPPQAAECGRQLCWLLGAFLGEATQRRSAAGKMSRRCGMQCKWAAHGASSMPPQRLRRAVGSHDALCTGQLPAAAPPPGAGAVPIPSQLPHHRGGQGQGAAARQQHRPPAPPGRGALRLCH